MNRRIWNGRFLLSAGGAGRLELYDAESGVQVLLVGTDASPEQVTGGGETARSSWIEQVELCWHETGVSVQLRGAGEVRELCALDATVHESLPDLYGNLHLPRLESGTRRFWQRLFLLARLPGGAALIRFLARRLRARA